MVSDLIPRRTRGQSRPQAKAAQRAWLLRALALCALASAIGVVLNNAHAQGGLRRCEDDKGNVTYSNQACPSGTSRERGVETRSAVEIPSDTAPAKKADERATTARNVVPSAPQAQSGSPSGDVAREERKAQIARCDDLVRRIEYGQQEIIATSDSERASVELGIRRLQEEHKANCAPR